MSMASERYTRRGFLAASAFSAAAAFMPGAIASGGASLPATGTRVSVFSKLLQFLDYDDMAEAAARAGFDGIDLTVRPGGHVLGERVEDDLPRAVEAAKKHGIQVKMIVTRVNDPDHPYTEPILKTASSVGVTDYRMGYYKYDKSRSVKQTLAQAKAKLRDLDAMNRHFGLRCGYQNHAGNGYVGAVLWDIAEVFDEIGSDRLGFQYDIRHATVEGGMSWPTSLRRIMPHIRTIVAKDFFWRRSADKWQPHNCPLGNGMVDFERYFSILKQNRVVVPSTLHLEYDLGGAEHGRRQIEGTGAKVFEAMRTDLRTLKSRLAAHGL